MNPAMAALGLAALLPMALADAAPAQAGTIEVALCSGATLALPLGDPNDPPTEGAACHLKACHGRTGRQRLRPGG